MGESRLQDGLCLTENARAVLSDSGTICEESALLGFPAITYRNAIEWPEARDAGTTVGTGLKRALENYPSTQCAALGWVMPSA